MDTENVTIETETGDAEIKSAVGQYSLMIHRTIDGSDPLVQEPLGTPGT